AEPGFLGNLRPGYGKPEHAGFCRVARSGGLGQRGSACLEQRFFAGFLPGHRAPGGPTPILPLRTPGGISETQQRRTLDFINRRNREHFQDRDDSSELAARIASYELAFRMQRHAPEVVDVSPETRVTKQLYGLDRKETAEFGLRCLLAR